MKCLHCGHPPHMHTLGGTCLADGCKCTHGLYAQVGHVHHNQGSFIARPSVLGNPFVVNNERDRAKVIEWYRRWLWRKLNEGDKAVMASLQDLLAQARRPEGVTLLCYCRRAGETRPECHADVVCKALAFLDDLENDPLVMATMSLGGEFIRVG